MSTRHMDTAAVPSSVERRLFPPGSLAERERAALEDAARLSVLWDIALRDSFRLGYHAGYARGVRSGRAEEATAWQSIVTGWSAVLSAPDRAELARLRAPTNDPCARRCEACSQCIRAAAVAANLTHYGRPDFPGVSARRLVKEGPS